MYAILLQSKYFIFDIDRDLLLTPKIMAAIKKDETGVDPVKKPATAKMLQKKTNEDFNNEKPLPDDPNLKKTGEKK